MYLKKFLFRLVVVIFLFLNLSACVAAEDAPARAVEIYYLALVEKDQTRLLNQSCANWESNALLEFDSFISVETELVDFKCQSISEADNRAQVTCEGAISASYEGEVREFPFVQQTFIAVTEGGEWRMCGYE
jgi:hypothetical protein